MTTPVSNIPLSIDYTSRDYYSLREDLITLVKRRVNLDPTRQWTGDDPTDFGVALVEAFAYIGDITNYYVDRVANENYLPTATQRKSIINIAGQYGYTPTGYRASVVEVEFSNESDGGLTDITNAVGDGTSVVYTADNTFVVGDIVSVTGMSPSGYNSANATVTARTSTTFTLASTFTTSFVSGGSASKSFVVPVGTQLTADVLCDDVVQEVFFTMTEEVIVPPAVDGSYGTATGWCSQGEDISLRSENAVNPSILNDIAGEKIGSSTQTPNMTFVLSENQVVEGSVQVYVRNGDIYEPWTEVQTLSDYGPYDAVYELTMDEDNFVFVNFGDGISGAIPSNHSTIKAVYTVGGGTIGNIGLKLINTLYSIPGVNTEEALSAIKSYMNVENVTVGVGGAEPEDNRSIRYNASKALTTLNRAVTLKDFASLALYVQNCGKANATAAVWNSVTLYVAPVRNVDSTQIYPGMGSSGASPDVEMNTLRNDVAAFLENKTQIGVSLTVSPPTYVPVTVSVRFSPNPQYDEFFAEAAIRDAILNAFTYAYLEFEQVITPEDIEYILQGLPSVRTAKVTALHRTGSTAVRSPLIGGAAEIFSFTDASLDVQALSTDSALYSLVPDDGTLDPTFNSEFFSYNLSGVSGILTGFEVSSDPNATVLINGAVATPGAIVDGKLVWTKDVGTPDASTTIVVIVVIAQDGTTLSTYSVVVVR